MKINVIRWARRTYLEAGDAERGEQIGRHAERHPLGDSQRLALLEAHVVVDVHHLTRRQVHQHVVQVSIAWKREIIRNINS